MRIAGLICSRLFMPLPVFGLAWPLSAFASPFRLGRFGLDFLGWWGVYSARAVVPFV